MITSRPACLENKIVSPTATSSCIIGSDPTAFTNPLVGFGLLTSSTTIASPEASARFSKDVSGSISITKQRAPIGISLAICLPPVDRVKCFDAILLDL